MINPTRVYTNGLDQVLFVEFVEFVAIFFFCCIVYSDK